MPTEEFTFAECEQLLEGLKSLTDSIKRNGFSESMMEALFFSPGKSTEEKAEEMKQLCDESERKAVRLEEGLLGLRLKLVRLRNRLSEH